MDFFSDLLLHILLWLELLFCLPQFYLLFLWERREFKFERWFFSFLVCITQVPPHDFLFSSSILTSERLPFGAIMLKNLYYFGCNTSVLIDSTRRIAVLNSRGKGLLSVAAAHYVPTYSQHLKALLQKFIKYI